MSNKENLLSFHFSIIPIDYGLTDVSTGKILYICKCCKNSWDFDEGEGLIELSAHIKSNCKYLGIDSGEERFN